jgi:Fe2+ transport system protein FeoA
MNGSNSSERNSNLSQIANWQKFTFFCDTPKDKPGKQYSTQGDGVFPLSQCQMGDCVYIIELQVAESMNILRDMGFIPGASILVQSCTGTGSIIVLLEGQSLGFGADMAERIFVTKVE